MAKHGGKREGSGRKGKAEEQKLCEKLSPLEDKVFKQLDIAISNGDSWAIKMYFEYMYGKPTDKKDVVVEQIQPLFPDVIPDDEIRRINRILEEKY